MHGFPATAPPSLGVLSPLDTDSLSRIEIVCNFFAALRFVVKCLKIADFFRAGFLHSYHRLQYRMMLSGACRHTLRPARP